MPRCTFTDDRTELVIEWNGSATFNVQHEGTDIDVFTVYGDKQAGPCSYEQAARHAQTHFNEMFDVPED